MNYGCINFNGLYYGNIVDEHLWIAGKG
jgi:hypothetical protein